MMKKLLMGNAAMAYGAVRAGVNVVTGYPGTPSTEVLETVARLKGQGVTTAQVEWSVNEKSALEVAAGAAYAGARCLVTMKQVGLNVAADPLLSLAYIGVEGALVVLVADDPGPISSQTEQDTRRFAAFAGVPVFDPSSPEEAYSMMADAFALSSRYHTPVLFRPTTRVCHANAAVELLPDLPAPAPVGFIKNTQRWVIFPHTSYLNHIKQVERNRALAEEFCAYLGNSITPGAGRRGIVAGGVSYAYAREALSVLGAEVPLLKVATPFPFPARLAAEFLAPLDEVLVLEELSPVLEQELAITCHDAGLDVRLRGKQSGDTLIAGENSVEAVTAQIAKYLGLTASTVPELPDIKLPMRPPSLCAGCSHRAAFYAVKQAMRGQKAVFCGDIGCYTLGNAMPLDMTDTCLCMGAGITIAQGIGKIEPDTVCFSFSGDSTFFHTGLAGVANAVYNGARMVVVILDNSTTAMTGHQPHPGTGRRVDGEVAPKLNIEAMLTAMGVQDVQVCDPLKLDDSVAAVRRAAAQDSVTAIIFRSPCIALFKPPARAAVDADKCSGCQQCRGELGCPALILQGDKVAVDPALCYGCGLCAQVCAPNAISMGGGRDA